MSDLITLSPVDKKLDRALLNHPGGFLWWYADLIDKDGNGAVFIWSFGLPFLPGLASAARKGAPQQPGQRPSLNISFYTNHELDFYALQEFDPEDVTWEDTGDEQRWRFGQHEIVRRINDDYLELMMRLSGTVPGTNDRIEGQFLLKGQRRQDLPPSSQPLDHNHDWTPLMAPCEATLSAVCGKSTYYIEGRGYHDRNSGKAPLHDLGFSHWIWGRVPFTHHDLIYYVLWPEQRILGDGPVVLGLIIDADGTTHRVDDLNVEVSKPRLNKAGGLLWHQQIRLHQQNKTWATVDVKHLLDEGPFYLRYTTDVTHQGEVAMGLGEFCRPGQVDLDVYRPLVNMRIEQPNPSDNSMWLPLFTGPKQGRIKRLLAKNLLGR